MVIPGRSGGGVVSREKIVMFDRYRLTRIRVSQSSGVTRAVTITSDAPNGSCGNDFDRKTSKGVVTNDVILANDSSSKAGWSGDSPGWMING